jgi:hypothetical protein
MLLLGIVLVFAALRANAQMTETSAATQGAIAAAADTARDITEDIATDSDLTDEERSSLLESSEATLNDLENPEISAEDSFVSMSDLESDLREQVEAMRDELGESNQGMQSAMDALNGNRPPSANPGEDLANELSEQQNGLDELSQEERDALSDSLSEAADILREQNEDLANSLDQAATAIDNNNVQQAQGSMSDAAQQAQSASDNNQARGDAANSFLRSRTHLFRIGPAGA